MSGSNIEIGSLSIADMKGMGVSIRYGNVSLSLAVLELLLTILWGAPSSAASFDCEKATATLEQTICSDTSLSLADEEMAKLFTRLKETTEPGRSKSLLREQRYWLQQRTVLCAETDAGCLNKVYLERIDALRAIVDNIAPFKPDDPNGFQGVRGSCNFNDINMPPNLAIYAAGQYAGRELDVQIDESGHQATQFDVVVNSPTKPVALILSAYEPSIWNVGWTKGTRILAVVATGYHRQVVAGLPKSTPMLISTNDNRSVCGWSYLNNLTLRDINPFSSKIFGKTVDMVYFASNGKVVIGSAEFNNATLLTSQDFPPSSFVDKTKPRAGPAGIRDAVAQGIIRPATIADAESWATRRAKTIAKEALPPVAGADSRQSLRGPFGSNVYVILKSFRVPAGLYGANMVTFYLPEGVPYPEGELGHSMLYDFNTMACRGAVCNNH